MKKLILNQAILDSLAIIGPTKIPHSTYKGKDVYTMQVFGGKGTTRVLQAIDFIDVPRVARKVSLIFEGNDELTPVMTIAQLCTPEGSIIKFDDNLVSPNLITGKQWSSLIGRSFRCDDVAVDGVTSVLTVLPKEGSIKPMAIIARHIL